MSLQNSAKLFYFKILEDMCFYCLLLAELQKQRLRFQLSFVHDGQTLLCTYPKPQQDTVQDILAAGFSWHPPEPPTTLSSH